MIPSKYNKVENRLQWNYTFFKKQLMPMPMQAASNFQQPKEQCINSHIVRHEISI